MFSKRIFVHILDISAINLKKRKRDDSDMTAKPKKKKTTTMAIQQEIPMHHLDKATGNLIHFLCLCCCAFSTIFYCCFYAGISLRPRLAKADIPKKVIVKTKAVSTFGKPPSLSKLEQCQNIAVDDIVLFKMKGSCPWPARVIEIIGKIAKVEFFGENTTQTSQIDKNFYKFESAHDYVLFLLRTRKTPLFSRSVQEAEVALGIPKKNSILNKI